MRATICVDIGRDDDVVAAEDWFARWRNQLTFVSQNEGCGCCVDLWNIEGPAEVVETIPAELRAESDWTRSGS